MDQLTAEIDLAINRTLNKEKLSNGFINEVYHTFKQQMIPILLKVFKKNAREEILPNSLRLTLP